MDTWVLQRFWIQEGSGSRKVLHEVVSPFGVENSDSEENPGRAGRDFVTNPSEVVLMEQQAVQPRIPWNFRSLFNPLRSQTERFCLIPKHL